VVSVGVVGPVDYLIKGRGGDPAATFAEELALTPALQPRIRDAEMLFPIRARKDFSYRSRQIAGDGWVLIGDAFGFLDPLYSSGVLLALKSGELAADAIADGLAKGDVSGTQLGHWAPMFNQGIDRMRRLVCEFYDGFSFGKFIRAYPHLKGKVTDLLIGDLFTDRVDEVWGPMESIYPPDKQPIPTWSDEAPPDVAENKSNELMLPDGPMR
jgi:flavin-dependent dehydrogenase